MIPLFTTEEFHNVKNSQKLDLKCKHCEKIFTKTKTELLRIDNPKYSLTYDFCSIKCKSNFESDKSKVTLICPQCNNIFSKSISTTKNAKNHFCSKSCNRKYSNLNKSVGTRRSKLEIWLEEQLTQLYPNLHIDFNKKSAIGSELDIHIPSLNLAFELNGIFHYEPIYGVNKLNQIKNNDKSKSLACHEAKIDLCTIDTSQQKYVKPKTSQKFLDIIIDIINQRTY